MPETAQQKLFEINGSESEIRLARTLETRSELAGIALRQSRRESELREYERQERIARACGDQILSEVIDEQTEPSA